MYFEQNIQALQANNAIHPHLLTQVTETAPIEDIELFTTEDNHYTLRYKDVFIHDINSPIQEARETVIKHSRPGLDRVHVIFGLGLGYVLDELFRFSEGTIVVYEPDVALMRFVLENVDLSGMLSSGRVRLAGADYQMTYLMREKVYKPDQIDVLPLRSYAYLMADEVPNLMEKIVNLFHDRMRDMRTSEHYHFRWSEALLENYPHFAGVTMLDDLLGRFEGKPALVISSGPSLDGAMSALHEVKDGMMLIAVGGALRRLSQEGIVPDFAVFYDAIGMKEQMHGLPAEYLRKINMIVSPVSQTCCFEAAVNSRIMFLAHNHKQISNWLDGVYGREHHRIDGGGSVSVVAFQVALALGCNQITLVGQDLAFPNNQAYAGGIPIHTDQYGRIVLEQSDTLYVEPAVRGLVKGQNGEMMLTTATYEGFARHFEDMALDLHKSGKAVALYNASIGGAHLEGYTLKPLSEFVGAVETWKMPGVPAWTPEMSAQDMQEKRQMLDKGLLDLRARAEKTWQMLERMRNGLPGDIAADENPKNPNLPVLYRAVESTVTEFFNFVQVEVFMAYFLMFEAIHFSNHYNAGGQNGEAIISDYRALDLMLGNCVTHLKEKLLPWIDTARKRIQLEQAQADSQLPVSA